MNPRKSKLAFLTIIICACITCMGMLVSCDSSPVVPGSKEQRLPEAPPVEVITAEKGLLSTSLQVPGELLAYQEVDLYAKESSFVKKVLVDVGSEVRQGQLLASLDAPELNAQLAEAQSRVKSQEAIYQASRASYDRLYETSKTPGTISPNDIEQSAALKNSQSAQLEAARSMYNQVVQTKNYLNIRAPFDGVISARNVDPGAYVGPSGKGSDTPLFVLQQQKRLRLVVSIPEAFTGLINKQDEVKFTVRPMPDRKFTAKINRLAGTLDSRLRAERVEMDVYNADKKLLPGMYAEVNLPLPASDSTFIVPKTAVVSSTERIFVIKVVDKKAVWVDVRKGREEEGRMEVYGDIKVGDTLIKVATDEIRNGSEVRSVKLKPSAL